MHQAKNASRGCPKIKVYTHEIDTFREGVADKFVIDYYHCRINDIQGLISLIVQ